METVIAQEDFVLTDEIFESTTSNWQRADVLQLTHHFHRLDPIQGQYERVNYYSMIKNINLDSSQIRNQKIQILQKKIKQNWALNMSQVFLKI